MKRRLTSEDPFAVPQKYEKTSPTILNTFTGKPYSRRYYELLEQRKKLPIWEQKEEFLDKFSKNQIIVLVGETGCGKTTQIPQFLAEANYASPSKMIACTQPRRVAAMSVARRVAEEMDVVLREQVGFEVRFEAAISKDTILKYVTDGMLLREAQGDPTLSKYSVIILDEAHERTVATDILMGVLKELSSKNSSLKIVIMSATLDFDKFQKYFNNAPLIQVPSRMHPVEIFHVFGTEKDYFENAITTVLDIHKFEPAGDILLFLTGSQEIDDAVTRIREEINKFKNFGPTKVVPLYSTLPPNLQQQIFEPAPVSDLPNSPGRKIIVATDIAETSLTIDGIVYVVDPGFCKQKAYNPATCVESLLITSISKASAKQRAGRAGRTGPGKAFRLYAKTVFNFHFQEQTHPEILTSNLSSFVLSLKKLGIDDLVHFDLMDPPAPETLMRALESLNYLGALDDEGNLTPVGRLMAEFPLDPQLAKTLISSGKYNCTNQILSIAALLSVPPIFSRPVGKESLADEAKNKFKHKLGDHLTLLNAYHCWKKNGQNPDWCYHHFVNHRTLIQAESIRRQLTQLMVKFGFELKSPDFSKPEYYMNIRKCLLEGFFMQIAYYCPSKSSYLTVKHDQMLILHPLTDLENHPQWVLYNEVIITARRFIRVCTEVSGEWLIEIAGHYYQLNNFSGPVKLALKKYKIK